MKASVISIPYALQLNLFEKYLAGPPKPHPMSMIVEFLEKLSLSASSIVAAIPLA